MDFLKSRWWAIYYAVVLTAFIMLFTGLIPRWGAWYSTHLSFRWQAERMLQGHLSMSNDPSGMGWDLAWGEQSVQQIWGLAVPFWRLPFETMAKLFGQPAFPDRIAFAVALAGVIYLITRFHCLFSPTAGGLPSPWNLFGLLPLVLFPPFLSLCCSRFLVYEEVEAYAFVACLLLLFWTLWLWQRPNAWSFLGLAFASGLLPFVRPTLGVYGFASLVCASLAFLRQERRIRLVCAAGALFAAAIAFLLWSNVVRFGGPLEFGHALAINGLPAMAYAARFDEPYHHEPIWSATRELLGLLFESSHLKQVDAYGTGLFAGQSLTFRWREFYFRVFDRTYIIIVTFACLYLTRMAYARRKGNEEEYRMAGVLKIAAIWSMLSIIPLAIFYLRFAFSSSRYLMDFAPAFSSAAWLFVLSLLGFATKPRRAAVFVKSGVAIGLVFWWIFEVRPITTSPPGRTLDREELLARKVNDTNHATIQEIPSSYLVGMPIASNGIALNRTGWEADGGGTKACVSLFVKNPECLILEVARLDGLTATNAFDRIQARIGLENLKRESISPISRGARIVFSGPIQEKYRDGIQLASLGMMSARDLSAKESDFRLLKVEWHRASGSTNAP